MFLGSSTAVTRCLDTSLIACKADASVTGVDAVETYASIACVSASMPVAAVSPLGMPSISRGSLTATVGVHRASMMAILTWRCVSVMIANRVISDAVPAVVLTATSGAMSRLSLSTPS